MQYFSRLATMTCGRSNSVLSSIAHNHNRTLPLCVRDLSSTIYRTADPAVHSEAPEGIDADEATKAAAAQLQRPKTEDEGINYISVKPATQGGKLESSGVNSRIDPFTQQKRRHFSQQLTTSSRGGRVPPPPLPLPPSLEDVSCVGLDGTPLPMEEEEEQSKDEEQREYYKYHKPSPISEIEMVDTRKPITRATDGGASESHYYGGGDDVVVWTEEQLDTAEEALSRATLIWKESAMRGDPDSPQSRALLRALLEERRGSMNSVN